MSLTITRHIQPESFEEYIDLDFLCNICGDRLSASQRKFDDDIYIDPCRNCEIDRETKKEDKS